MSGVTVVRGADWAVLWQEGKGHRPGRGIDLAFEQGVISFAGAG